MTPADHYTESERILGEIRDRFDKMWELESSITTDPDAGPRIVALGEIVNRLVPLAQVHATLATATSDRPWPQKWMISCSCTRRENNDLIRDEDCPVHAFGVQFREHRS